MAPKICSIFRLVLTSRYAVTIAELRDTPVGQKTNTDPTIVKIKLSFCHIYITELKLCHFYRMWKGLPLKTTS